MPKYKASGDQNLATPDDSAMHVVTVTASLHRLAFEEFWFSVGGTPADNVVDLIAGRITGIGTEGAAVTPVPMDDDSLAADADCGENHSAEPTYTSSEEVFDVLVNTRAFTRWVAGRSLVITPNVNNEGLGFKTGHASATDAYRVGAIWEEL